MNIVLPFETRIQHAFLPGSAGVVEIVDKLLALAQEHSLEAVWQGNECRVRLVKSPATADVPIRLPRSAFRAILARVAARCANATSTATTPYQGQAELKLGDSTYPVFVGYVNTPDAQRLELRPPNRSSFPPSFEHGSSE